MKLVEKKDTNFIFYLLAVVIFFATVGFTISGEDGLIRLYQLKKTKNEIIQNNRALLQENVLLRMEQKSLLEAKTIEHRARESLGLAYADEVVYITRNAGEPQAEISGLQAGQTSKPSLKTSGAPH